MALHLNGFTESLPDIKFRSAKRRTDARYQVVVIKTRLQEALTREQVLVHQVAALTHQQEALTELLGSGREAIKRIAHLTSRERQIMAFILAGHPNKNIAADIGISQRTVENHRAAIMSKTGSKSLPALVNFALAAIWRRIRENESAIEFTALTAQIEGSRANHNAHARHHGMQSA